MERLGDLGSDTDRLLDDLVEEGRFATREDAVRAGMQLLREQLDEESAADEPLDEATIAAVRRGLADAAAGRVSTIEEVRKELRRRFEARR